MTPNEFQSLAMRTDCGVDEDKLQRLRRFSPEVYALLVDTFEIGMKADQLKRHIFYADGYDRSWAVAGESIQPAYHAMSLKLRLVHGLLGVISESAELVDAFLKSCEEPGSKLDVVNVGEECADACWYHALILDEVGIAMGDVMSAVIEKLRKRFPEKFTEDCAIDRDVNDERQALCAAGLGGSTGQTLETDSPQANA